MYYTYILGLMCIKQRVLQVIVVVVVVVPAVAVVVAAVCAN